MLARDRRSRISPAPGLRRSPRRRLGDHAEGLVARQLTALGWTVLGSGVNVGRDEIDLIAVEPGLPPTLVFVEVRSSRTDRFGTPEESVGERKLARVYRAAFVLLRERRLPDGRPLPPLRWRLDLVAVDEHPAIGPEAGGPVMRHVRGVTPR
jgi:Holliday junction resolvase-like predicted endonuclease